MLIILGIDTNSFAQDIQDSTILSRKQRKVLEKERMYGSVERETKFGTNVQKISRTIYVMNYKGYDTNYVALPKHPFLINVSYLGLNFRHTMYAPSLDHPELESSSLRLTNNMTHRINLGFFYRGMGMNFGFALGNKTRRNLDFSFYARRFGLEISHQRINGSPGEFVYGDEDPYKVGTRDGEGVDVQSLKIGGFLVINPKRFSYPAVLKFSTIQKKTAGGFFVSATYFHCSTDASKAVPYQIVYNANRFTIKSNQLALGAGYGINIVPSGWKICLHAAVTPTLLTSFHGTLKYEGGNSFSPSEEYTKKLNEWMQMLKDKYDDKADFTFCLQYRAGLVYNVSERIVLGANVVVNDFETGNTSMFKASTQSTNVMATFGIRF